MRKNGRNRRRGFTLLEILIVVGILALLAAFVVPNLLSRDKEAKVGIVKSYIGRTGPLGDALMKYRIDMGSYPTTSEGLQALFERPSGVDEESGRWKGPYLDGSAEQLKDPWQSEYQYKSPGDVNQDSYDLWSNGPDLQEGTDDDITNWTKK